jgi:hypothetical protein
MVKFKSFVPALVQVTPPQAELFGQTAEAEFLGRVIRCADAPEPLLQVRRIPGDDAEVVGLVGQNDDVRDLQLAPDSRHIGEQHVVPRSHFRNGKISIRCRPSSKKDSSMRPETSSPRSGVGIAEDDDGIGGGLAGLGRDGAGDGPRWRG